MAANRLVLRFFGPALVLTGLLGLILPPNLALMSGAVPYDVFHIVFGLLGALAAYKGSPRHCRLFNAGFGAIDLYQLAAHQAHWFPEAYFRWNRMDDAMHLLVGAALVGIAAWGK